MRFASGDDKVDAEIVRYVATCTSPMMRSFNLYLYIIVRENYRHVIRQKVRSGCTPYAFSCLCQWREIPLFFGSIHPSTTGKANLDKSNTALHG